MNQAEIVNQGVKKSSDKKGAIFIGLVLLFLLLVQKLIGLWGVVIFLLGVLFSLCLFLVIALYYLSAERKKTTTENTPRVINELPLKPIVVPQQAKPKNSESQNQV